MSQTATAQKGAGELVPIADRMRYMQGFRLLLAVAAGESVAKVAAAIAEEPEKTAFPMGLIFVMAGFMGLQGRIDRNDPKLALAPVFADPDLEFRPPSDALAAMED